MQCPVCKGEKTTVVLVDAPRAYHGSMRVRCERCNGTGEINDDVIPRDRAILRKFGYTDEQIDSLSPAQRETELRDAADAGITVCDERTASASLLPTTAHDKPTAAATKSVKRRSFSDWEAQLAVDCAELRAEVDDLKRRNSGHMTGWSLLIISLIGIALAYCTTPTRAPHEIWDLANRCDTLRILRKIANSNLADEDEKTAKSDAVINAIRSALAECRAEDFDQKRFWPPGY